ncbi:ABC transporter substrate-binding protein [Symbiopectobacterium purcellii]|uniref:ABC transporter substrate-binding protein n=1 Tax=Symbiopectobacterium purcellii TaxID=2871826 RepID=A0ABX9AVR2_9ENTR|nr:ABC transporter substrate-binding protein [Symbiopectobacterium purcellii]QZN97524.1 ABC transporter substrate-binding protein [Symbiopectobacterium purcellii]
MSATTGLHRSILALTLLPLFAQAAPTTVNVVGFSGVFADNYQKLVIAPFEAQHPDIKINYQQSKNSAESLALLTLQRNDPHVDVALLDISVAIRANTQDLFAPLDNGEVKNLHAQPDWAVIGGQRSVAFSQDNLAILYNTDRVKQPPTSWNDLTDAKYKGRIAAPLADTRGVTLLPILTRLKGGDYKQDIEPGFTVLKAIAPNVATWDPAPDCYAVVQSGEVDLAICWNGRAQYLHDKQDGKIGIALPREGSIGQINTISLVKGSKQASAAQQFIDYALSAEAQRTFAEQSFYGPVNTQVTLSAPAAARIYGSKEAQQAQWALDWPWVAERYAPWIQRIRRDVIALH